MTDYLKKKWKRASVGVRMLFITSGLMLLAACYFIIRAHAGVPDNDGMDDAYEVFFGLDITTNDASLNQDGDDYQNITESHWNTDPFASDTDRDGFYDSSDSNPVSRAYLDWGNPQFTNGAIYRYTRPAWFFDAEQTNGTWQTSNPTAWTVASNASGQGTLFLDLDRTQLVSDLVLRMKFFDHANSSLMIDLLDTNDNDVVTNLFGNLLNGSLTTNEFLYVLPFATNTNASVVRIRQVSGDITIYESSV
ncbi:MAG: hypothetical protein AAF492_12325, partial [Verrucomicrobiota bacterium]